MARRSLIVLALASLLTAPAAGASASDSGDSTARKLAHRGPSTFAVGLAFTVLSPFKLAWDAATGGRPKLQACRFGHGLKMLVGGAVLLPAGLLTSPFQAQGLPDAWMDGVIDAYQEDYCLRPAGEILP